MTEPRFNVGDEVIVRQWDDMVREYGYYTTFHDSINVPFRFVEEMKYLCGKRCTIEEIQWAPTHKCYAYCLSEDLRWKFSEEMLVHIDCGSNDDVTESSEINLLLGVCT